ncbi:MAG: hypothetical protein FJY91_01560 [Candidatus Harrisonbacteria bacterium]|nr:hypothetical protein [Candidatus Harrisonbacteria bacterium]
MRIFFSLFLMVLGIGFGFLYVLRSGYLPLAIIGSEIISKREYDQAFALGNSYLNTLHATYKNTPDLTKENFEKLQADLPKMTWEKIIQEIIVRDQFATLKNASNEEKIEIEIDKVQKDPRLLGAVEAMFHLSPSDFREQVVLPLVMQEEVQKDLVTQGIDPEKWLKEKKLATKVLFLTPGFSWTQGEVH